MRPVPKRGPFRPFKRDACVPVAGERERPPGRLAWMLLAALLLALPLSAEARCGPGLVLRGPPRGVLPIMMTAARPRSQEVVVQWFGHSFFRLVSPQGIRVVTDPFGPEMGLPVPDVSPHVVTVSREHPHHNSVWIAGNRPLVLRGLEGGGQDWARVRETVGDVLIYNVPVTQRTYELSTKGAAFVFETGGICIAHLGDVAETLIPSQLRRLGKIHVAMVPIGGTFTMGPEEARAVVDALRPHIAIPMHYWDDAGRLERFLRGAGRVQRMGRRPLRLSRRTLPRPTLFVIMGHG